MGRKQAREGAMQLLFQMDSNEDFTKENLEMYLENFPFDKGETDYIEAVVKGVLENREEIDNSIQENLQGWLLDRIARVDLATLRLAIFEIKHMKDIPIEVSINEAIEIAKKYSTDESYKYVNGVLGGFVRSMNKDE
ncbi:transcription antitermination factor NusB [Gudongella sp. DL1XJH-153]|uniref:transcription antitermination factor NusB n=1 Tax=Gudongella sp. DL1XJH-153 TaxID=3409804 RepID=UPI003BB6559F